MVKIRSAENSVNCKRVTPNRLDIVLQYTGAKLMSYQPYCKWQTALFRSDIVYRIFEKILIIKKTWTLTS
jgi:hypothetical protein